ncbi:hypothetical protein [Desulfocurvus sp. DL9XJH121]
MKGYSLLLAVLWAVTVFRDIWSLAYAQHVFFAVRAVGATVLFTLCLAGALELGWGLRLARLRPSQWRLAYLGCLGLGALHVLAGVHGELLGLPAPEAGPSLLRMGLNFLPYLLFAIPVIILEHERNPK